MQSHVQLCMLVANSLGLALGHTLEGNTSMKKYIRHKPSEALNCRAHNGLLDGNRWCVAVFVKTLL